MPRWSTAPGGGSFRPGLRGEYTSVASQAFGRSYFGLFPNVSVSRALNALRTWLLVAQWSRNIERPAFRR